MLHCWNFLLPATSPQDHPLSVTLGKNAEAVLLKSQKWEDPDPPGGGLRLNVGFVFRVDGLGKMY